MLHDTHLHDVLQGHLTWNRARISFIVAFITGLITVNTVNLKKIAQTFPGPTLPESSCRRIQRFLSGYTFDYQVWARMVLRLIPVHTDYIIAIDRTNGRFGAFDINILMAAVAYKGTAMPLVWILLPKKGASNTGERIDLLHRIRAVLHPGQIKAIVGDREFVGTQWFAALDTYRLPYYMRITEDTRIHYRNRSMVARTCFRHLKPDQATFLRKKRHVQGQRVWIAAVRLKTEFLIVISNRSVHDARDIYRQRWGIEVLLASLKRRGFHMESTHLRHRERIEKLVALLSLAFTWAHLVGVWVAETEGFPVIKPHGRPAHSLFRLGLNRLQHIFLHWGEEQEDVLFACVELLVIPLLAARYWPDVPEIPPE